MPPPNTPEDAEQGLAVLSTIEGAARSANVDLNFFRLLPVPAEGSVASRSARPSRTVDLRGLTYLDPVDDNLLCPICAAPFVEPVTTPCDHTFCRACLKRSCKESPTCPVDREHISLNACPPSSRLIKNQLDSLQVACPNAKAGCGDTMKREVVLAHVQHRCPFQLVACPEAVCPHEIARRDVEAPCQHVEVGCAFCEALVQLVDMDTHLALCPLNFSTCVACGDEISHSDAEAHQNTCQEMVVPCQYVALGCLVEAKRGIVPEHQGVCEYRMLAFIGNQMAKQQAEIESLTQERKAQATRIADLERVVKSLVKSPPGVISAGISSSSAHIDELSTDFRVDSTVAGEMAARFDGAGEAHASLARQLDELSKTVSELDTRQTVLYLNQVMPIKDQIAELRSTLGILKMHVTWLLNSRREELERNRLANRSAAAAQAQARAAGDSSAAAVRGRGAGAADGIELSTTTGLAPRRLSDGSDAPRL